MTVNEKTVRKDSFKSTRTQGMIVYTPFRTTSLDTLLTSIGSVVVRGVAGVT